jgi:hypothetical protein
LRTTTGRSDSLRQSAIADLRADARFLAFARRRLVRDTDPIGARAARAFFSAPYYRLVYGESDGLPGLVIDRFGDTCVAQIGTAGMERLKPQIQLALQQVVGVRALLYKNDSAAREMEGLPSTIEQALGEVGTLGTVVEDGLRFEVPLLEGQKTGWFFDQAANRRALVEICARRSARARRIQLCGSLGSARCRERRRRRAVVDSSAPALELALQNAQGNSLKIRTRKGDAFDVLEELAHEGARFDVVIVDPPAFAKRKKDLPKAQAAYKRLNQLALQPARAGGNSRLVLVLLSLERRAAAGRDRQGRARRGQASADRRGGRPGARPSRASGDSRDALLEGLFLSGYGFLEIKVAR